MNIVWHRSTWPEATWRRFAAPDHPARTHRPAAKYGFQGGRLLGMGSLAMLFGLLFLLGLLAAIYKMLARRPGAWGWLACSLAGLTLYVCMFFFIPGPHTPPKGGPPSSVANSQTSASAPQGTPTLVIASPPAPPAKGKPTTTAKSVYAPAATAKSVYVPAGTAGSVYRRVK